MYQLLLMSLAYRTNYCITLILISHSICYQAFNTVSIPTSLISPPKNLFALISNPLDDDTIKFLIKQSKTDQTKKGHHIYIFNTLVYINIRKSQTPCLSDPFFDR